MRQLVKIQRLFAVLFLGFLAMPAAATTYYVDVNSANPTAPYADWSTAATNIQDAVNGAMAGDTVLVTNGFYKYGTGTFDGTNRVYVASAMTVQSVNGPAVTAIVGYQMPGHTNGVNAIRCVFLSSGATLSGFTLTNGATEIGESAGGVWCPGATVSNCVIVGNTDWGGAAGAQSGTLENCIISNNFAVNCGGIQSCTAYNCLLTGNSGGSAAVTSTLYNCTIAGNTASGLAAAQSCTLYNSIIYYNYTGIYANCYQCNLTNSCTTLGLDNFSMPANCLSNSPSFVNASGDFHLNPWSRCVSAGNTAFVTSGTDLDGNPRIVNGAVDMGCYENQSPFQGIAHYVSLTSTNPTPPYTNWMTASTNIQVAVAVAQPGDDVIVDDGVYTNSKGLVGANGFRVALTNGITLLSAGGPQAAMIVGGASTRCAFVGSQSVLTGFTLTNGMAGAGPSQAGGAWCDVGSVISNCFILNNQASIGGGIYGTSAVYNCVISNNTGGGAYGGILNNCIITHNSNSSGNGGGAYGDSLNPIVLNNCVISNNTARIGGGAYGNSYPAIYCNLNNCLVSSNFATGGGGGVYQARLNNCIIISNAVPNITSHGGGGVGFCVLTNCTLIGNFANQGGGAYASQLTNCTLIGNTSPEGGGALSGTLCDCLVVSNTAGLGGGAYAATLDQCAVLDNMSLNGEGGGAFSCTLNNCLVSSNMALNLSPNNGGGGVWGCNLTNCLLTYNFCATNGGAAYESTLVNCTVAFNSGPGGVFRCQATNCILYYNSGVDFYPNTGQSSLNSCCTPVLAMNGLFNITNAPLFVNSAGDDFHLSPTSPCINSGNNIYVAAPTDLDGNPRIQGGTVDIGAYEYQTPTSVISYAYLQQYGLPTDGSVDLLDLDGTGFNVYQDWIAGLNPTNPASVLVIMPLAQTNNISGINVTWQSVSGILYNLQRTTNLPTPFSTIQSNIMGAAGTTSYLDTSATNGTSYFYRVGVQTP